MQKEKERSVEKVKYYFRYLIKWSIDGIVSIVVASIIFGLVAFAVPGPIVKAQLRYHPFLREAVEKVGMLRFVLARIMLDCVVYEKNLSQVSVEEFRRQELSERTFVFDKINGEIDYFEDISRILSLGLFRLRGGRIVFEGYLKNSDKRNEEQVIAYLKASRNVIDLIDEEPDSWIINSIPSLPDLRKEVIVDFESIDRLYNQAIESVESGNPQNLKEQIKDIRNKIIEIKHKYIVNIKAMKKELHGVINKILEV